jgi:anti-anti-sigma regulatory factor
MSPEPSAAGLERRRAPAGNPVVARLARRPLVLAVDGVLEGAAAPALLGPVSVAVSRRSGADLVVDLRGTTAVDGAGVDALATASRWVRGLGAATYLVGASAGLRRRVAVRSGALPVLLPDRSPVAGQGRTRRDAVLDLLAGTPLAQREASLATWARWAPDVLAGLSRWRPGLPPGGAAATPWGPVEGVPDVTALVEAGHGEREQLVAMLCAAGAQVTPEALMLAARIAVWVDACRRHSVGAQRTVEDVRDLLGARPVLGQQRGA